MSNIISANFTNTFPYKLTLGPHNEGFVHDNKILTSINATPFSPLGFIDNSTTSMSVAEEGIIDFEGQGFVTLTSLWNVEIDGDTTQQPLRFAFKMHVPLQHLEIGARPYYQGGTDTGQPGDSFDSFGHEHTTSEINFNATFMNPKTGKNQTLQMNCVPTSTHTRLSVEVTFQVLE